MNQVQVYSPADCCNQTGCEYFLSPTQRGPGRTAQFPLPGFPECQSLPVNHFLLWQQPSVPAQSLLERVGNKSLPTGRCPPVRPATPPAPPVKDLSGR